MSLLVRAVLRSPAAALVVAAASCAPALPAAVREDLSRAPKGTATVVLFSDFQCPHCRRVHAMLDAMIEQRGARVDVVLRHVPLRMHPDARPAARAAICAERLAPPERAHAYATSLFASHDLSDEGLAAAASEHGIDPAALRRCAEDPATEARIARDATVFGEAGGNGVPLLYVGTTRIDGAPPRAELEAALDDAITRAGK